jgi:hypothetical protein
VSVLWRLWLLSFNLLPHQSVWTWPEQYLNHGPPQEQEEKQPPPPVAPVAAAMSQGAQGDGSPSSEDAEDLTPMPPLNLGDPESDDDDDNNVSSDGSSSSNASTHSSNSNKGSGTDDEGEVDPIPMGLLDGKIALKSLSVTSCKVLDYLSSKPISLRKTALQVIMYSQGLFSQSTLDSLFKKDQLNDLRILVVQHVMMFHPWLNDLHGAGKSLTSIALEGFTNQVMATLVDVDSYGSTKCECNSTSSKGTGLMLPTFNGNQSQYKVWSQKWPAYLSNMKNANGIPFLYVIVNAQKEKRLVRRQVKGASLKGSQFKIDNFKVSQLLESALADQSASIYMTMHAGNGQRAYLDLDEQYAGSLCRETRVQEIMSKLKTLKYWGAKSFPWDKFTNILLGYYDELYTLHAKVNKRTQVNNLVDMIIHFYCKRNFRTPVKARALHL